MINGQLIADSIAIWRYVFRRNIFEITNLYEKHGPRLY